MKITRVKSQIVKLPAEEPLAGGPGFYRSFFGVRDLTNGNGHRDSKGSASLSLVGPSRRRSSARWTNSANY